ncbi:MAG: hypothetical protein HQK51_00380 [Oligoflexia bacterium]|nr:hypothetical protein [Oligoflexia bacterium]
MKFLQKKICFIPLADDILSLLRRNPHGVTRTEIRDYFNRNKNKANIDSALNLLSREDLAYSEPKESGGKPTEMWFAKTVKTPRTT